MHVDEVLCHGENGGATCETSHQGCIMRKVISKAVTAGGRFDFFLDSDALDHCIIDPLLFIVELFQRITASAFGGSSLLCEGEIKSLLYSL